MKRVLMTADAVGGVYSYALDLADQLCAHGVEVVLAVLGRSATDGQRARARSIAGLQWNEAPYRLEWEREPWRDVAAAGHWLRALVRRTQPDLVHLNGFAHGALEFGRPVLVVAHSCVLSWWKAVKGETAPECYAEYRAAVCAGLRGADCVVAPTYAMRDALLEQYGPLPRTRVIYNGCDLRAFTPRDKSARIVGAGRVWDEAKNLRALLRVEAPWPIVIAGEGDARDGRLLGMLSRDQMRTLLGEAAIYAAPARYEPFGLGVLEAAAAGCALVLGDIASLRELWHDAALFVPPDDQRALQDALHTLCSDASLRRQLAARAYQRAQRFPREATASGYLALYQRLVTARGKDPECASSASIIR